MTQAPTANTAISISGVPATPQPPFQLLETRPDSITWHVIWDYELDKAVNISRPITLGVATLLLGSFIGLLPSVTETLDVVIAGRPLGLGHLALAMTAAICFAAGCVSTFFACRGQLDAFEIKKEVRTRNLRAVYEAQQAPR